MSNSAQHLTREKPTFLLSRRRHSRNWFASSKNRPCELPKTGLELYSYRKIRADGCCCGILSRSQRLPLFLSCHVSKACDSFPLGFSPWIATILMDSNCQYRCYQQPRFQPYSRVGSTEPSVSPSPVPAYNCSKDDCISSKHMSIKSIERNSTISQKAGGMSMFPRPQLSTDLGRLAWGVVTCNCLAKLPTRYPTQIPEGHTFATTRPDTIRIS